VHDDLPGLMNAGAWYHEFLELLIRGEVIAPMTGTDS
jgi:hypothetical protein